MHEIIDQIISYLRGMWRFRWFIYVVAWPVCLAGWFIVDQIPDEYRATARVHVDTQSMLRPLLRGLAATSNLDSQITFISKTLFSRPNLEKIARMTDMDLNAETEDDMNEIVARLKSKIQLVSDRQNDNLFSIAYVDSDPQLAKQVVQSFITLFIENTLGDKRKDTDITQKFIGAQIKIYEDRLIEAENRLKEFKRKNLGLMPGSGEGYYSQLKSAKTRLSNAELELREVKNLRDELKRQLAGEEPTFGFGSSLDAFSARLAHPFDGRIQQLEERLDDLLLRYTDRHPDVVAVQETMKNLKEKRDADLEEAQASMPDLQRRTSIDQNPVYQQLKISYGQAEARVASMLPRAKEYRKAVRRLESLVDTIPQIEADLKSLNRDYSINKGNYEKLLVRRESAKLAEDAEQTSDNVKFKVIDPPFVGSEPVAPNRPLMMSVVFVAGCLAGLAFVFFLSQLRPTIDGVNRLREFTGLPVLGSVSMIRTDAQKMRRRIEFISFAVVGSILFATYAGVLVFISKAHITNVIGGI